MYGALSALCAEQCAQPALWHVEIIGEPVSRLWLLAGHVSSQGQYPLLDDMLQHAATSGRVICRPRLVDSADELYFGDEVIISQWFSDRFLRKAFVLM